MAEEIKPKVAWKIILKDKDGKVVKEVEKKNLIVDVGRQMLAYLVKGDTTTMGVPSYVAIGTGTVAPAAGDTALGAEAGRKSATITVNTATFSTKFEASWGANDPSTTTIDITEAGLFTAATGGNMLNRLVFGAISKAPDQTLTLAVTVSF